MSIATTWGTNDQERALRFACDRHLDRTDAAYYRGVTIAATPDVIFRWLCQMRVAPYSYDWIDNLGRTSPRTLTAGLDALAVGQRFMSFFELVEFEKDVHLTVRTVPAILGTRIFGEQAVTYLIIPLAPKRCRLLVKSVLRSRRGPVGWLLRLLLPWGDLVMMRQQLLNFRRLAESAVGSVT